MIYTNLSRGKMRQLVSIFFLIFSAFGIFAQNTSNKTSEKELAEQVWEKAIQAKGGHEKISKIDNFLETYVSKGIFLGDKKYDTYRIRLHIIPYKYWDYYDAGKSVFGRIMTMENYENLTEWFTQSGGKNRLAEPITKFQNSKGYQNPQIALLLEVKGLKLKLLGARLDKITLLRSEKNNKLQEKEVYLVETMIDERKVEFAFDKESFLPIQFSFYWMENLQREPYMFQFYDYVENNGLKVPKHTYFNDGHFDTLEYEFNVDYDPEIFERSPLEMSPDAWRKKH